VHPTPRRVSPSTVRRLSLYLRTLESFREEGVATVSSEALADRAGATAAQLRKDLSLFGSFGKRGTGYPVEELERVLRSILGLQRDWRVALVGAGRIGTALFAYGGFPARGFRPVAVFDADPAKVGTRRGGMAVQGIERLEAALREAEVDMVVLAVPAGVVQELLDRVVAAGVRALLNFAPTPLRVPPGVTVNDVNLVMELEALSFALAGAPASTSAEGVDP